MRGNRIVSPVTHLTWVVRCLLAMCAMLVLITSAHAKNVLILSTRDSETTTDALDVITNLVSEFTDAGDTVNHIKNLDVTGAIDSTTFGAGIYDLVVVARLNAAYNTANVTAIEDAIARRAASGFALFYDTGGNGTSTAATDLKDIIKTAGGITLSSTTPISADVNFQLNSRSPYLNAPYQNSFDGLNPLRGGWFFYMNGVPAPNVLFLAPGVTLPPLNAPPSTLVDSVYSVFIPATQSFGGKGACLIATADTSMFESRNYNGNNNVWGPSNNSGVTNIGKIAPAFSAALAPGGACGIPAAILKAFVPKTVGPGDLSTLTITIDNTAPNAVSGLNVTDNLPSPLVFHGPASSTCTGGSLPNTTGSSTLSLTNATLPIGGCTITVPVRWPAANVADCVAPNNTRTNTITPGTDFTTSLGQDTVRAVDTLTCEAGMLAIEKTLVWQPGSQATDWTGKVFPVDVACTSAAGDALPRISTDVVLTTATTGTINIGPVVTSGSCTVTEQTRPAAPTNHQWAEATPPSAIVTMQPTPAANEIGLTNTVARQTAAIDLRTTVSGGPAGGLTSEFGYTVDCGADGRFSSAITLNAAHDGAVTIAAVPLGASCTATQSPLPGAPANYVWGSPPAFINLVVVANGNTASFANTLTTTSVREAAPVPTLGHWALLCLSAILAGLVALGLRRRGSSTRL